MKIIQDAIRFPVTTTVGVILLVLFGAIGLSRLPIQLTPDVVQPEVTVRTEWPGASPEEVERDIIDEQEEQLKSLDGLFKIESSSEDGQGTITLTFQVGTDMDAAVLKVSNSLDQVRAYPSDADKPFIRTVNVNSNASAWYVLRPIDEGSYEGDISTLWTFIDDSIKPEFERVPGVAFSSIYGGREQEMQVIVDPARLAARAVTMTQLRDALERENRNYSGGEFDEGKRRYVVRTVGEYTSPREIEEIVVTIRNQVPIYVKDIARVELGYRKPGARVFDKGQQVIALNALKEPGANVIEMMAGLRQVVERLNTDLLAPRGLRLTQVYDETEYINSSISLVRESLFIGGLLAVATLLLFLRSVSSTLVIALAIPISIVGSFLMMYLFGRTLNVISLAGMAFAVGMVVDNSIVVLENIYRHSQMGKSRAEAAFDGAREVWGAVLASTLTTIAVFVPVIFIEEEVGQLFGDIALGISFAVGLSLLVSITVIPSLSAKILSAATYNPSRLGIHNLFGVAFLTRAFIRGIAHTVYWINGSVIRRLAVILLLTGASLWLSFRLAPKAEYLPVGNQNFMFGLVLPPPGLSLEEVSSLHDVMDSALSPMWEAKEGSPEAAAMPGGGIRDFFFVASPDRAFLGASSHDPLRVGELRPPLQAAAGEIPGAIAFAQQASIFQRGIGQGRNIDVELSGPELEPLIQMGYRVMMGTFQALPGAQAIPRPSLDLGNPEVRIQTNRLRAAALGISNRDLGFAVSALVDGARASDYQHEGKEIDLWVVAEADVERRTHLLEQLPIAAPNGQLVTLGSVAQISEVSGPQTVAHSERRRAITIQVTPDEEMPLETAMDLIQTQILDPLRQEGLLGGLYQVNLSGAADKLTQTGAALKWNFLLALVITYLLMASLFESFVYPFVIMFSVPLAALGGILGLAVMNRYTFQALDVLTMLGFFILVGTVVNNAILIVHQSLNHIRLEGMEPREAIRESVSNRIRPIFMTVGTSVLGMLPLVLFPGAGSELYRGLGSVVVGGLIVSTIFTLFVVPALLSLTFDIRAAIVSAFRGLLRHPAHSSGGDD